MASRSAVRRRASKRLASASIDASSIAVPVAARAPRSASAQRLVAADELAARLAAEAAAVGYQVGRLVERVTA